MLYTPKDSKGASIHWTGTSFVRTGKSVFVQEDREIDLFWLCMCYQSMLPIIKNKTHLQNIARLYTKELLKDIAILKEFHRKCTKQPEIRNWGTSYETLHINKHWKQKFYLNQLHVSDKSCKTRSKHKPFYVLKWPMCDFEKQGSHLIIMIKTGFCVEIVKKYIYCGLSNTAVDVKDIIIPYTQLQQRFRFTKSSGNLEILTSICPYVCKERRIRRENNIWMNMAL